MLDVPDYLDYLAEDSETKVIAHGSHGARGRESAVGEASEDSYPLRDRDVAAVKRYDQRNAALRRRSRRNPGIRQEPVRMHDVVGAGCEKLGYALVERNEHSRQEERGLWTQTR